MAERFATFRALYPFYLSEHPRRAARGILERHGLDHSKPLGAVVQRVTGVSPEANCTGGTSDGRFLIDICPELVELTGAR